MMTPISFQHALSVPEYIVVRDLDGESVLLNLESEVYFGLDEVGTRMWQLLTTQPTIRAAYDALLAEYDVAPQTLQEDLMALIQQLLEHGLATLAAG